MRLPVASHRSLALLRAYLVPLLLLAALVSCDGGTPTGPEPDRSSELQRGGAKPDTVRTAAAKGGSQGGQFTIILFMSPADPLDVGFSITGQKKEVLLDDDDADATLPDRRNFSGAAGDYTVTMKPLPAGYKLVTMGCSSVGGNANDSFNFATSSMVIRLEAGEAATCHFVVAVDHVAPTVTVARAATQADPTMGSSVQFTAAFSEPVDGFTASDVLISGTAGGTLTAVVTGSWDAYTITINGITSDGTVGVSVPANTAFDGVGNGNLASTGTGNSVERNTTRTVSVEQAPDQPDPASDDINIRFVVKLGEPGVLSVSDPLMLDGPRGGFLSSLTCNQAGTTCLATCVGKKGQTLDLRFLAGEFVSLTGKPFYASTGTDTRVFVLQN
jgi:hypothetical protein